MKCPLIFAVNHSWGAHGDEAGNECLQEKCAWWVDGEEGCLLVFIEKDLAGIWTMLTEIVNKMPHAGQSLK